MTTEQLQAARAAHWHQDQSPILTLEDADGWFSRHPLSLFLPRRAQLPAPAPSFVEACLGAANATPPYTAVEQANGLLAALMASGSVLGLNLLGTSGEQPDFLAHSEALPFLISLRGERDWKHAPGSSATHKVSPLVVELWKTLEQAGPLTAAGIREKLGRELTESAVLRALNELWQSFRAIPVLQPEGQPAIWELLETHHGDAIARGSATSQVTAISLLVSMYLQSVYAASSDEIEIFLSPLASRSRIREAVRGLSATRQIHSLSMETQTYYFLEDGLAQFAEAERPTSVTPRRHRVAEPKPARTGAPAWAKVEKPPAGSEDAAPAKFVPVPNRPVPSPDRIAPPARRFQAAARSAAVPPRRGAPASAAGRGSSRPRPDRGDFQRRKDSRPSFGKRPDSDQGRSGRREGMAEGRSARASFAKQGGSGPKRPAARAKERWRNTPGKPGYQPDRVRPQGGAPGSGGFSRPARPFAPAGERRGPPGAGYPARPRSGKSAATRGSTAKRTFPDRGAGTQGFERPRRRPPASTTFSPQGEGSFRAGRPTGPTRGRASDGGFRVGKATSGDPRRGKPQAGRLKPGRPGSGKPGSDKPGAGRPHAGAAGRSSSAWSNKAGARSDKAGGSGPFPKARPRFGAKPGTGAGNFSKFRHGSGHSSGHNSAGKGAKRSPNRGGFTPGGRPDPGNKDRANKDRGRKRPEA